MSNLVRGVNFRLSRFVDWYYLFCFALEIGPTRPQLQESGKEKPVWSSWFPFTGHQKRAGKQEEEERSTLETGPGGAYENEITGSFFLVSSFAEKIGQALQRPYERVWCFDFAGIDCINFWQDTFLVDAT